MGLNRKRKANRLENYDYSQDGYYFVTICAKNKIEYFGGIRDGVIKLSEMGEIADRCWREIPQHFANIELDEYVIMPNHVHGIIISKNNNVVGNAHVRSVQEYVRSVSAPNGHCIKSVDMSETIP